MQAILRAYPWRLVGDYSRYVVIASKTHPPHLWHIGGKWERRHGREDNFRQRDQLTLRDQRISRLRRFGSIARPGVEVEQQSARTPSLLSEVGKVFIGCWAPRQ